MSKKRRKRIIRQVSCLETRLARGIATGMFFAVFLFLLILYVVTWANYQRTQDFFMREGLEVQGKVVSLADNGHRSRGRAVIHPIIEFSDHHDVLHSFTSMYGIPTRVGNIVSVLYLPDSPNAAILKDGGIDVYNVTSFNLRLTATLFAAFLFWCALFYEPPRKRK